MFLYCGDTCSTTTYIRDFTVFINNDILILVKVALLYQEPVTQGVRVS